MMVIGLGLLRISGTSIGIYEKLASSKSYHDPNLLFGSPRALRSDEYSVNTPLIVSQSRNGFKVSNNLVGRGQDLSVVVDVPYLEWSAIFKPQNWPFFILPLEQAFAFKWWLLGACLVASCYGLLATLLPNRRLFSFFVSVSLLFTPFVQWWYQTITIAPLIYSFAVLTLLIKLTSATTTKMRLVLAGCLAYSLTSFALVLYPPFQIPCLLGVLTFFAGYWLQTNKPVRAKLLALRLPLVAGGVAVALVGIFILTRLPAITAITHTIYPGQRVVSNGGFGLSHFFAGPFLGGLQADGLAAHYDQNQSEASTFIMLWPVLLLASGHVVLSRIQERKQLPYALIAVNLLLLTFTARLFLPLPLLLTKPLLINSVPHNRLLIGIGLLGILQLAMLVRERPKTWPLWLVALSVILTLVLFTLAGLKVRTHFPGFIPHLRYMVAPILALGIAVWGMLSKRPAIGAAVLLGLSVITTNQVNPLYRGLGPLTSDKAATTLRALPAAQDHSEWIFVDAGSYINYLIAEGIPAFSATYSYPQLALWERYDPTMKYEPLYNRYANAFFSSSSVGPPFYSLGQDNFIISYNPCSQIFADIKHVMSSSPLSSTCLKSVATIPNHDATFKIYDVKSP